MKILITGSRGFIGKQFMDYLSREHDIIEMDLKIKKNILKAALPKRVDKVIHFAAQTDAFSKDAMKDAETNIIGTLRLAQFYGPKLVHISTSMVNFDHAPYAISKGAAEKYARHYGATIVRLCNIYGTGGHSAIDKFRESDEIHIFGDGSQIRTYAPVGDAIRLILKAMHGEPGTMHILSGRTVSVKELAEETGKPIKYLPPRDLDIGDARQRYGGKN